MWFRYCVTTIKRLIPFKIKRILKNILTNSLNIIINFFMVVLSLFIPKSKAYVIVGGWNGKRYADNSRAFYEYLLIKKNELGIKRVFWYTKNIVIYNKLKNEGLDVLYGVNARSIYWHLRCGVHIIDWNPVDILYFLSVRSIRINLWHAIPMKKVYNYLYDMPVYTNKLNKLYSPGFWRDQYILATSEWSGKILSYAFGVSKKKCLISSYPRNHRLYENIYNGKTQNIFTVFYLPTFRDNRKGSPLLDYDLETLNKKLKKSKMQLFLKLHFADRSEGGSIPPMSNIKFLKAEADVYDWLYKTDLLITDYSSVFYDFTITKKPILFYPYDYDNYKNNDRGFIMPYNEYTPGEKVFTVEDLIKAMFYIKENYEEYMKFYLEQYDKVRKAVNKYLVEPNYRELEKIWIDKRRGKE